MEAPKGLLDRHGRIGKIIAKLKVNDEELHEYPHPSPDAVFPPESGITSTCFSLASPGDIITIGVMANKGTADLVDVYVDGILRGSSPIPKGFSNLNIKRMIYREADGRTKKRKSVNLYEMMVKERDTSRDVKLSNNASPSEVGTIVLKCWRKNTLPVEDVAANAKEPNAEADAEKTMGPPNYESHNNWYDLNRNISSEGLPPPFEMGFCNPTKYYKYKNGNSPKERVDEVAARKPGEYTLFAEFIFYLRSTSDLTSLGYPNVPLRQAAEPTASKPKGEKESTTKGLQGKNEPQPESKPNLNDILGLFHDHDDDAPPLKRPAEVVMHTLKLEPKVKASETPTKRLKNVPELPHRTIFKDIFRNLPEGDAQRASSRSSTPGPTTASEAMVQTKAAANDNEHFSEIQLSLRTERSVSQVFDKTIEAAKSEEVATMSVFATKQLSNKEIEEQVAMKVTPVQELFFGGLKHAMKVTKPFVPGLKAAPAYRAWLERGPLEEVPESRSPTPIDRIFQNRIAEGKTSLTRPLTISAVTERNAIAYSQQASSMDSSTGLKSHGNQNEPALKVVGWISQPEQDNQFSIDNSQRADVGATTNKSGTLRRRKPDSTGDDDSLVFKQSPSDTSDILSEATEVATELEMREMVKRSQCNSSQMLENSAHSLSFQSLPRGSPSHSRPSPILGSSFNADSSLFAPNTRPSRTSSFGLRVRSVSPSGLAATKNRLSWLKRDTENERPRSLSPGHHAITDKDGSRAGNLRPVQFSPWCYRSPEVGVSDSLAGPVDLNASPLAYVDEELDDDPMDGGLFVQSVDLVSQQETLPRLLDEKLKSDVMSNDWMDGSLPVQKSTGFAPPHSSSFDVLGEKHTPDKANTEMGKDSLSVSKTTFSQILLTPRNTPSEGLGEKREIDETNDKFSTISQVPIKKPQLVQPHYSSSGKLSQKRKLDATDCQFSNYGESARKTNKPRNEQKTTEVITSKLQGFTSIKRKADYMTDAAANHCSTTPKEIPASEPANLAITTAEPKKIKTSTGTDPKPGVRSSVSTPTPSKKGLVNDAAVRATPDRMLTPAPLTLGEISAKRKATQERISAAAERKDALRKELEDAQLLKQQLNEIREMELAAESSERENEELQAQIEAIYGAVKES